ncbi:tRNA(Ile)-lysidine synthetase [Desulfosporosinus acidiphilus SJ4]|uniref:tRNA(Ile)-lysidine synthase n=1 Tax=Desulfosporosinus acidiphilus (strain DSM 22704 / JCM 16185 / SJ4) TaxID=646529 RepID=I4D067_DESAJ|nr:tRNA lysidine(34) synthetase TilS [Desulfosporosinus acidiphilus]AFM39191.1 tRNA(Ile)-lysidine synthetase [Desulfosporosinus acidiphilus SJ4]
MFEKLRTYILPELIPRDSRILVAVSGGPDSMALGHILWRYMHEDSTRGISLVITHVHHGVRKESDQELELVQQMADLWEIPCLTHRFDSKGYAHDMGQSFQEAAREWRYARWQEDMRKEECTLLATAHHLGDQAETILYRILRGSGTAGLAGIYPSKDSIIRPLLTFTKEDIFRYCELEKLPYAIDQSNHQPVYVRNRIRLELIPSLERDYNPRLKEALGRMGELLRWDQDYLVQQMKKAWDLYALKSQTDAVGLRLEAFKEPEAILSRLLRQAAMLVSQEPRGLSYTYVAKIMSSRGKPGWSQELPGLTVKISEEGIWFYNKAQAIEKESILSFSDIPLQLGTRFEIPGYGAEIALLTEEEFMLVKETPQDVLSEIVIFDKELLTQTRDRLVCRTRQQGDKMWLPGVGHKSLKKIFQEAKINSSARNNVPLVAVGNEVLWIPNLRQSGLWRPKKNAPKVYCVMIATNWEF